MSFANLAPSVDEVLEASAVGGVLSVGAEAGGGAADMVREEWEGGGGRERKRWE